MNRDELIKKSNRTYIIELLVFAAVFLTLSILAFVNVLKFEREPMRWVYVFLTLAGGAYFLFDFIWALASPKKRAKSCLLDKALVAPASLGLIVFDVYALIVGPTKVTFFRYVAAAALAYFALVYVVEAIYHKSRPLPMIVKAVDEEIAEEEKERLGNQEPPQEEQPKEETKDGQ